MNYSFIIINAFRINIQENVITDMGNESSTELLAFSKEKITLV